MNERIFKTPITGLITIDFYKGDELFGISEQVD